MLHDLLDPLWLVDEAWGRAYSDLVSAARSLGGIGTAAARPLGDFIPSGMAAESAEQLSFLYGIEAEGLVAGPHTVPRGIQGAAGIPGQAQLGAVVVIPIFGLTVQHRSWLTEYGLATSMDYTLRAIQAAVGDPQVGGIVLRFNSGGGPVYGVKVLADYLLRARKEKPIWGHADSVAASAAYWVLSCCGRAIATPMADLGSVGCFLVHMSYQDANKQLGIKTTVIRAGKNKADANEWEDLTDDARVRIQARIDSAYAEMTSGIGKGRGISAEKVRAGFGEGAVVDADVALEEGMIDAVAPFQDTMVAMLKEIRAQAKTKAVGARAEADVDLELMQHEADLGLLGKA